MRLSAEHEFEQNTEVPAPPGYIAISANLTRVWGDCRCNLYRLVSWSRKPQLFCEANHPLSPVELNILASGEVISLYVQNQDFDCLQADLYARLDHIIECEDIPLRDRYNVVKNVVSAKMQKLYQLISLDGAVEIIHNMGQKISQLVFSSTIVPSELLAIAMHDTDTFKHLINVSTYAVLLAKHLGIVDKNELKDIATGGLLHDIGKRFMPQRLINKTTAYNDKDRQLIGLHPAKGYEELHKYETINRGQKMMVYQHHEWMNGQGYPVGITGEEIHLWARICAVVDVHEALTGKRNYRKPATASEALDYLDKKSGTHFDKEILQCWKLTMH